MTQNERKSSRREARHMTRQRRRSVWFVALGAVAVVLVVAIALVATNGLSRGGQSDATLWSAPSYVGGPRLAVDRSSIDEGPVGYGHEVHATYRLKNVGDTPLTLQQPTVEALEGC